MKKRKGFRSPPLFTLIYPVDIDFADEKRGFIHFQTAINLVWKKAQTVSTVFVFLLLHYRHRHSLMEIVYAIKAPIKYSKDTKVAYYRINDISLYDISKRVY